MNFSFRENSKKLKFSKNILYLYLVVKKKNFFLRYLYKAEVKKMNDISKIGIENIQRIPFDKLEKDFAFIVNGQIYKTNSFVANILSPDISKKFEKNLIISHYEINTKYEGDFDKILQYGEMKAVDIKQEERQYFENIMKQLGNNAEYIRFSTEFQGCISLENVIQRLQIKKELDINLDEEIAFISSNFHDFYTKSQESIFALDIDIIERIISNDQLKLYDEEELFDIILKLYTESKEHSVLFSYVIFMNLTIESIRKFNQSFDINDINKSIWDSLSYRLEQEISTESRDAYQKSHKEFLNNRYLGKRYEKIIQHLREEHHGNVHTKNIIHITSSPIYSEEYKVENVVEENDNTFFQTVSETNPWIQFDFKERKVLLDHYTLKTFNCPENNGHLKNWILEVSNDGKIYEEIDRQENCNLLNGMSNTATFKVSCSTPQKFVRITRIGPNWSSYQGIAINHIEFSGFLYE